MVIFQLIYPPKKSQENLQFAEVPAFSFEFKARVGHPIKPLGSPEREAWMVHI